MTASTETDRASRQRHTDCVYRARAVDCPTCQAASGQPCTSSSGRPTHVAHRTRQEVTDLHELWLR